MLFAVTNPTGSTSVEEDEDSLLISKSTKSEDMSFTHLADNSITPIIPPRFEFVAVSLIDLIEIGVE
jgi:hypothetical protein